MEQVVFFEISMGGDSALSKINQRAMGVLVISIAKHYEQWLVLLT